MKNIKQAISDWFYGLSVKRNQKKKPKDKQTRVGDSKRKMELIFYISFVAIPILQFFVFYVAVNVNSIRLAFSDYDIKLGKYVFVGLDMFKTVWKDVTVSGSILATSVKNSLIFSLITTSVGVLLALLFSYYIFKKHLGSGFFRVMLFLPSIISAIVLVLIFKYFANNAYPSILDVFGDKPEGLLVAKDTRIIALLFFNIFIGFGPSTVIYASSMSSIDTSIIEAGQLDGVKPLTEFTKIVFPLIFPTFTTFIVTAVASLFNNQFNLFSFFGESLPNTNMYTMGYYIFRAVNSSAGATKHDYAYLSALGLLCSCVAIPITFLTKHFMEKYDPTARD